MGIIPLFDWGEANALFFMEKFTFINKARSRIKVIFSKSDLFLIFSFEIRSPKQARENAYLTKSNFYAIIINHFFLFLIWYCRTAFMCCISFSKVSILFSSSSLVAIFLGDKFLDIYTIKKVTYYPWQTLNKY